MSVRMPMYVDSGIPTNIGMYSPDRYIQKCMCGGREVE